jgi:hypothetical protein
MNAKAFFEIIDKSDKNPYRLFIPNVQKIFSSEEFWQLLEKSVPDISRHITLIYAYLQLHRFNIGNPGKKSRKDNLIRKDNRELTLGTLHPSALEKEGINPELFGRKTNMTGIYESLINSTFRMNDSQAFQIDDFLYEERPHIKISKKGLRKYIFEKLSISDEIARQRKALEIHEIKKLLIKEEIFTDEEYDILEKTKEEFYRLLQVKEQIVDGSNFKTIKLSEFDEIIEKFHKDFSSMLIDLRDGKKREFVNDMLSLTEKARASQDMEKLNLLFDITDRINIEKKLYMYLAQKCERIYEISLGTFCRRILPFLVQQESLSRAEIRMFILMNVNLRFFNQHITQYNTLIRSFISIPLYSRDVREVIIERNRTEVGVRDVEKVFKKHIQVMRSLNEMFRSYDKETKFEERRGNKFVRYSEEVLVQNKPNKKVPEGHEENELVSYFYEQGLDSRDSSKLLLRGDEKKATIKIFDNKNTRALRKKKKKVKPEVNVQLNQTVEDPIRNRSTLQREYRDKELKDFLDKSGLPPEDKTLIEMLMDKYTQEEIARRFRISQQAVSKRIIVIQKKLGLERTLKILSD